MHSLFNAVRAGEEEVVTSLENLEVNGYFVRLGILPSQMREIREDDQTSQSNNVEDKGEFNKGRELMQIFFTQD